MNCLIHRHMHLLLSRHNTIKAQGIYCSHLDSRNWQSILQRGSGYSINQPSHRLMVSLDISTKHFLLSGSVWAHHLKSVRDMLFRRGRHKLLPSPSKNSFNLVERPPKESPNP